MAFTRKQYDIIASIINESVKEKNNINQLVGKLAYEFKEDNKNFKPKKFIEACFN